MKVRFNKENQLLSLSTGGQEGKYEREIGVDLTEGEDWRLCIRVGPGDQVELEEESF